MYYIQADENGLATIYGAPPEGDYLTFDSLPPRTPGQSQLYADMDTGAVWWGNPPPEPIPDPTPAEQRKLAYETLPIIDWHGETLTVDAAAALWVSYAAEDSDKAAQLTNLIIDAKQQIRGMYPDEDAYIAQ